MPSTPYATPADLQLYLPDVPLAGNQQIWTNLLNVASRWLDNRCGQYFYDDGYYPRRYDGLGSRHLYTQPFWVSSGTVASVAVGATSVTFTAHAMSPGPPLVGDVLTVDFPPVQEQWTITAVTGSGPYVLTLASPAQFVHVSGAPASTCQLRLAYYENQPRAQWTQVLSGDGVSPPTNYFLWPRNRPTAGSSSLPSARRPYYGVDIAHIPVAGTTFLPASIPGFLTVELWAHWGWPAVPDVIKDLTCKIAAKLWRARDAGWAQTVGSVETGVSHVGVHWDAVDEETLWGSDLINVTL